MGTKISALADGAPAVATDVLPIARAGGNKKLALAALWAGFTGTAKGIPYFNATGNMVQTAGLTFDPEPSGGLVIATDFYALRENAGDYVQVIAQNDSAATGSTAYISAATNGTGIAYLLAVVDGDCYAGVRSPNGQSWVAGVDSSDGDQYVLSKGSAIGTANVFKADGTTFEVVDVLKINNTVAEESQLAGTHVVSINIGGVAYKLLAVAG